MAKTKRPSFPLLNSMFFPSFGDTATNWFLPLLHPLALMGYTVPL